MDNGEKCFTHFYKNHYNIIRNYCISCGEKREDADEIASEAFGRLWNVWTEHEKRTDKEKMCWLYKATRYIIKEYRRDRKTHENLEDYENHVSDHDHANQVIENDIYQRYIAKIKRHLDDDERQLFQLAFIVQLPYSEIMEKLGITSSSLRSQVSRLRKKLSEYVKKLHE